MKRIGFSIFTLLLLLFVLAGGNGCARPQPMPQSQGGAEVTIYVVAHEWHTGLVVPVSALTGAELPVRELAEGVAYLELSWGDRDFFQSREFSWLLALKAAFLPSESVMHVVGFNEPVPVFFPESKIVQLGPAEEGFKEMMRFVKKSFAVDQEGEVRRLGSGLYGRSSFYRGSEKYFLPRTCNVWTARALAKAGYPVSPLCAMRAGSVLQGIEGYGKRLR